MLKIRQACASDVDIYFKWVNDPEVRESAINTGNISYDDHVEWFSEKINNPEALLFIFHVYEKPLGQVRFDFDKNGHACIDYSIDVAFRGKGLSALMLKAAIIRLVLIKGQDIILKALVKDTNQRSERVFEKLGFQRTGENIISGNRYSSFETTASSKVQYIIANVNPVHEETEMQLVKQLDNVYLINSHEDLRPEFLERLQPEYVFFLHWSHIIPAEIHKRYNCILFHMTDLPFGRGGSPLQNLIIRKIRTTKISAIKVDDGLDTGDVYLKMDMDLSGTAAEIFRRAGSIMRQMILEIITNQPEPVPQQGEVVVFKRRKPSESNIAYLENLEDVFDHIRMLDAAGYPKAFIETANLRIEFSNATLKNDKVVADVRIIKK